MAKAKPKSKERKTTVGEDKKAPAPSTAVATTETKAVAPHQAAYSPADWGQANLTSKDVIIPRILLMQPMSPQVTDGKAVFGEWRESLNEEVLGKMEVGFDVVPFFMQKVWIEYKITKKAGGKQDKEFMRVIPITPENENLRYEDESPDPKTGEIVPVLRDRVMNFYVLLKKELELGGAIPYILSFRKSSLTAGKKLTTQMYMKNINAGKNPASMVMHIFAKKTSGVIDGNTVTWAVADVKPVEQTPDKMIGEAFRWLQIVKDGNAKVHEESYAQDATVEQPSEVGPMPEGTGKF